MTTAAQSITIKAPATKIFKILTDFENYPKHQPSVISTAVERRAKTSARVAFTLNIITKVSYTLDFKFKAPHLISWKTFRGDSILKSNAGSWEIEEVKKGTCKLNCHMEAEFGPWIPRGITTNLVESHLPDMLSHFKVWAES